MEFMKKVTEISKKVGDAATETYNTVAEKSGKMFEEAKLKMSISTKEGEIDEIYLGMGKTVYDMYAQGEDVGKVFTKESKKIDKLNTEIKDMNKKILFNKKLRTCEKCGKVISLESVFCSDCGTKQKPVKIKEEAKEKKEEKHEEVCPQCGTISDIDSKYCSKCGYDFKTKK